MDRRFVKISSDLEDVTGQLAPCSVTEFQCEEGRRRWWVVISPRDEPHKFRAPCDLDMVLVKGGRVKMAEEKDEKFKFVGHSWRNIKAGVTLFFLCEGEHATLSIRSFPQEEQEK